MEIHGGLEKLLKEECEDCILCEICNRDIEDCDCMDTDLMEEDFTSEL